MKASMKTLIIDNGAYSIKADYAEADMPRLFPNAIIKAKNERKRIFISNQIEDCKDLSSLYYILPFQKGYLLNWDIETQIWNYLFGKDALKVDFDETRLIFTEPIFDFASISETLDEIMFEEYQFQSVLRANAATLSAYQHTVDNPKNNECVLVVDSGYSFTHIVPYRRGRMLKDAVLRISIGGKLLTNHLKEIISYRQLHVMDETYVMNQCKEDACFVSRNFQNDMRLAKLRVPENTIVRDYVLPDFSAVQKGYARVPTSRDNLNDAQLIRLNHERFTVPELLFHPSDQQLQEMGITEALCQSVFKCPTEIRDNLLSNICLTGGNCLFDGFEQRVYADVRSSIPDDLDVRVHRTKDPITYAWRGAASLSSQPVLDQMVVTKSEYEEHGHSLCRSRFGM